MPLALGRPAVTTWRLYNLQLSLGPPPLITTNKATVWPAGRFHTHNWENRFCPVGNWIYFWISHQNFASLHREDDFLCLISFSHCRNVLHKGVDIEMGLKHREDEFSFVKLASLQERTTQGCRILKRKMLWERQRASSKPSSLKVCMGTSACHRN